MITKTTKKFGRGSAHIVVPKEWIGKLIQLIPPEEEGHQYLTKKQIEKLVEERIQQAKQGY